MPHLDSHPRFGPFVAEFASLHKREPRVLLLVPVTLGLAVYLILRAAGVVEGPLPDISPPVCIAILLMATVAFTLWGLGFVPQVPTIRLYQGGFVVAGSEFALDDVTATYVTRRLLEDEFTRQVIVTGYRIQTANADFRFDTKHQNADELMHYVQEYVEPHILQSSRTLLSDGHSLDFESAVVGQQELTFTDARTRKRITLPYGAIHSVERYNAAIRVLLIDGGHFTIDESATANATVFLSVVAWILHLRRAALE